jgi:hypothetical protein
MFNSTADAESKLPFELLVAAESFDGISPVESLVSDENGFLNDRSTASLIFSSCEVSQSTRNNAIIAVTKSA